ncbi:unnamed protein product [Arctia plantaginis]|uniref:BESS domain-containing protein n=1 Tax=Arctia plantaginis TaxID=874455 RepID=A0A8S1AMW6_ARCPL|nr:unnamed protein product [Arctia plantaginis]
MKDITLETCAGRPRGGSCAGAAPAARHYSQRAGDTIKKKWKSMRDGYIKYKKQLKGTTRSERKSISFMWSAQLSFLDSGINPRGTASNVSGDHPTEISENSDMPATATFVEHESLESSNPISTFRLSSNEPIETPRRVKKKTREPDEPDVDNMIKSYLEKKKTRHDDVDYLFLSYAQTFKKLSQRKQAMLKVGLAKLFSEAEISEMSSTEYVNQSPAYSVMSLIPDNTNSEDSFIHKNVEQISNMPQDLSNAIVGFSISKSLPLKNITNTIYNLENVETDHQSTSKANNDKTSTKQPVLDGAKNLPLSERNSNEASWLQKKLHKLQLSKNSMSTRLKKALKLSENATFQKAEGVDSDEEQDDIPEENPEKEFSDTNDGNFLLDLEKDTTT